MSLLLWGWGFVAAASEASANVPKVKQWLQITGLTLWSVRLHTAEWTSDNCLTVNVRVLLKQLCSSSSSSSSSAVYFDYLWLYTPLSHLSPNFLFCPQCITPSPSPSLSFILSASLSSPPFSPPCYSVYLCTESAFQSSMPQACREPDHGVNYTPTYTLSLLFPTPLFLRPIPPHSPFFLLLTFSVSLFQCVSELLVSQLRHAERLLSTTATYK